MEPLCSAAAVFLGGIIALVITASDVFDFPSQLFFENLEEGKAFHILNCESQIPAPRGI